MKSLDELNREKSDQAAAFFHGCQIREFEKVARLHADKNEYRPPSGAFDVSALADHVYLMAYSRRKYKIAKAKREADGVGDTANNHE